MDIKQAVNEQFNKLIEEGKLESIIQQKLEKLIDELLADSLRSYSDFGKKLSAKLKEALNVDFSRLNLVDYNHVVLSVVKESLDNRFEDSIKKPIADQISDYFGKLEKKEWKLSEIIDEFKKETEFYDDEDEITLVVDKTRYYSTHIYIDKEGHKKKYDCEYQLSLNTKTGVPYSFQAGKYNPHKGDLRSSSLHGAFEKFLFRLYAQQATIIINEDECDIEINNDYD
jgi:hypothetical protein